jgi:hypothetical protein
MTKAMLLFLVTSVALGMTSLHLVRELRAERANVESLQARVSELEVKASQPPPAATTPFATRSVQKAAPPPATPASANNPPPPEQMLAAALHRASQAMLAPHAQAQEEQMRLMQEYTERQRALMSDPEYRDALRVQHRSAFVRTNPDVIEELGLTREQADQFFSLLAEQTLRAMDVSQATLYDPAADPKTIEDQQRKMIAMQRANEAEIARVLGPQKLKAWQEYQSTAVVRYQANDIAQLLASNGVPLQPELAKPLRKILAQEQKRMEQETQKQIEVSARADLTQTNMFVLQNEYGAKHLERLEEQSRRTREALSSILTPQQLEIYAQEQDANIRVQRAQWSTMREYSQAGGDVAFQRGLATMAPMVSGDFVAYPSAPVAAPASDEN